MARSGRRPRPRARRPLSRRAFLKRTAAASGALVTGALATAGAPPTTGSVADPGAVAGPGPTMRHRTLGRTDLKVSEIGFGGFPIDDPQIVRYAIERGINYIDTAHCYRGGRSEEIIGEALAGRRDRVTLTTKWCPHHVGKPAKKQVFLDMLDASLRRLRTDHVDIILNHGVGFIAMKTLAGAKGADLDKFRDRYSTFKQAALKWVLSNPKVSNLIISINSTRQVDEYVPASGRSLEKADLQILKEYEETFSTEVCRFSGACLPACPQDVRIADILRFSMYYHEYHQENRALESYANLVKTERAAHCAHCAGFCEKACAYDLPIKTLLIRAHDALAPEDEA